MCRDCGVYMLAFAEYLSYGLIFPWNVEAKTLRRRFAAMLWDYGRRKIMVDAKSDNEAPPRRHRKRLQLARDDVIDLIGSS